MLEARLAPCAILAEPRLVQSAAELPCTDASASPPFSWSPLVPLWLQHRLPDA